LTERGVKNARRLGCYLNERCHGVNVVFCAPSIRTCHTAQICADFLDGVHEIGYEEGLCEWLNPVLYPKAETVPARSPVTQTCKGAARFGHRAGADLGPHTGPGHFDAIPPDVGALSDARGR